MMRLRYILPHFLLEYIVLEVTFVCYDFAIKMYIQRHLTQLLYLFMLWQPGLVYPTIFRPLFFILKAYTIGKKRTRYY